MKDTIGEECRRGEREKTISLKRKKERHSDNRKLIDVQNAFTATVNPRLVPGKESFRV